ncbi:hypothetical protein E4U16_001054 [Claviceps sp. LM84 group G4]|nr:hypothetical protein E4U16_001054 [Claviceps sp. LM84 group G4]
MIAFPVTISPAVVDRLRHDTQAALSVIVHSTLVDSGSQLGPERRPFPAHAHPHPSLETRVCFSSSVLTVLGSSEKSGPAE